jgi:hypothetical protein
MTRELFLRKSVRTMRLLRGGAVAVAGAAVMALYSGGGVLLVVAGVALVAVSLARDGRPIVTMAPGSVRLRLGAPVSVQFGEITRVERLQNEDISVHLTSGQRIAIPNARLEDGDGNWLVKELRKEMRAAR